MRKFIGIITVFSAITAFMCIFTTGVSAMEMPQAEEQTAVSQPDAEEFAQMFRAAQEAQAAQLAQLAQLLQAQQAAAAQALQAQQAAEAEAQKAAAAQAAQAAKAAQAAQKAQAEQARKAAEAAAAAATQMPIVPAEAAPEEMQGKTYVDVNLGAQTLTYFVNGSPVLSTPCVTGSPGRSTPTGVFAINSLVPGKYLTGPTWHVWVNRWMRFVGNVGIHDASWRKSFGGNIYKTNGSHGCVNIPRSAADQLFGMVSLGTVVIVH